MSPFSIAAGYAEKRAKERYGFPLFDKKYRARIVRSDYRSLLPLVQLLIIFILIIYSIIILEKNSVLYIRDITINCSDQALKESTYQLIKDNIDRHFFTVSLDSIRSEILESSLVHSVAIRYSIYPIAINVDVEKRVFWAEVIDGDNRLFIDLRGEIFQLQREDLQKQSLIPIINQSKQEKINEDALSNIIRLHKVINSHIPVKGYYINNTDTIALSESLKIILPNIYLAEDYPGRLSVLFNKISNSKNMKDAILLSIDLRFRGIAVFRKRGQNG